MTVEEKIIDIKLKVENAKNVKELKEHIGDLTKVMDDLGKKADKTDEELKDYNDTVDALVDAQNKLNTIKLR